MKGPLFLGMDVGTTGVKVLLVNGQGNVLGQETSEYPLLQPQPLWAEQNPADWWSAAITALNKVSHRHPLKGRLVAIGLTGQMHGSVFLDRKGEVIRPAILWCDQRTGDQVRKIEETVGKERLNQITGNPVFTGFTAPKILWLRQNEPDAYQKIAKILLPKDYLRFKLTGEFASDVTDNSGTSMFDVSQRRWSLEILEALRIKQEWLAPVFESSEVVGKVERTAASLTGVPEGTPVVAGAGDQAASGVGNGVVSPGIISSTIGTSGVIFAFSEKVLKDPAGRIHFMCHAVPGKWHLMGVCLSSGGSLRWFRDNFCQEEIVQAKREGRDPYEIIAEEAKGVPPGCEGLIFLPYLTGERTPHADPLARAVFFGATSRHTKKHFLRAVMEGVVFGLRDSIEAMKRLGLEIEEVRASGGGARSDLWCQIQADIFHQTIFRTENPDTTSLGAAILAACGVGYFKTVPEACRVMVKIREKFLPDPKNSQVYDCIYQVFGNLYPILKPSFDRIAKFEV